MPRDASPTYHRMHVHLAFIYRDYMYLKSGGVRGIPVQRSCIFLISRSLFSLQIISRSLFWEHSPFTVLSNNYSLFTVLR